MTIVRSGRSRNAIIERHGRASGFPCCAAAYPSAAARFDASLLLHEVAPGRVKWQTLRATRAVQCPDNRLSPFCPIGVSFRRMEQRQSRHHGYNDNRKRVAQALIDLAMVFMADLHVGSDRLYKIKRKGTALNLRYEIDGELHQRSYLSALSWRAILLFALTESKAVTVLEMDQPGRYRRLFPNTLRRRLHWHARANANFPPVVRLYDPNGTAVMLLTRSRCCGHAVDVLHNLTDAGPVFQPLWISDIMALRPMLGIEMIRDEAFSARMPIGAYLEAAAMTGRIVEEPELADMPLTGNITRLNTPPSSQAVRSIFDHHSRSNPALESLRCRTIYEDYRLAEATPHAD